MKLYIFVKTAKNLKIFVISLFCICLCIKSHFQYQFQGRYGQTWLFRCKTQILCSNSEKFDNISYYSYSLHLLSTRGKIVKFCTNIAENLENICRIHILWCISIRFCTSTVINYDAKQNVFKICCFGDIIV